MDDRRSVNRHAGSKGHPTYGRQVFAFRITEISPTVYRETRIPTPLVKATSDGWNAQAMHHVDLHQVSGRWIAAVDAKGTRETPT
jgi:hypothetical protein